MLVYLLGMGTVKVKRHFAIILEKSNIFILFIEDT